MKARLQDKEYKGLLIPQGEDENSESDVDNEYKIFLDHLREDGYSYVLEMSPVRVKYEEEDEPFSGNETESQGNSESDPRQRRCIACKKKLTNSESEREIFFSNAVKRHKLGKTAIDPSYQEFLNHLRVRGDSVFLELDNGITIKYGEQTESPNASIMTEATRPGEEPELLDGSLMPLNMPIPMFEHDATSSGTSRTSKMSYFEKGLRSLCDKPFDQDEYEHLLHEVSTCKPKERHRHLRNGVTKTYKTQEMGKSLLDHHPNFAERIRTACCLKHCLKQLRGFMFWLQKLAGEGAFQPWNDEQFNLCDNC